MISQKIIDDLKRQDRYKEINDDIIRDIISLVTSGVDNDQTLKEKIKNKLV